MSINITSDYLNFVYTVPQDHINCLRLSQHLMHPMNIWGYTAFSYVFRLMSTPSSGSLIFNCSVFGASTGCNHLPRIVTSDLRKILKNSASVRRPHFTNTFGQMCYIQLMRWKSNSYIWDSLKTAPTCAETRRRIWRKVICEIGALNIGLDETY